MSHVLLYIVGNVTNNPPNSHDGKLIAAVTCSVMIGTIAVGAAALTYYFKIRKYDPVPLQDVKVI